MKSEAPWFLYVARCADGTLYTGIARDVAARVAQHNRGEGARYTRGRGPLVVCATLRCATKGDALRLELAVKALDRDEKERLFVKRRLGAFARRVRDARRQLTATKSSSPLAGGRRPSGRPAK